VAMAVSPSPLMNWSGSGRVVAYSNLGLGAAKPLESTVETSLFRVEENRLNCRSSLALSAVSSFVRV
jgi:hypothetical protein